MGKRFTGNRFLGLSARSSIGLRAALLLWLMPAAAAPALGREPGGAEPAAGGTFLEVSVNGHATAEAFAGDGATAGCSFQSLFGERIPGSECEPTTGPGGEVWTEIELPPAELRVELTSTLEAGDGFVHLEIHRYRGFRIVRRWIWDLDFPAGARASLALGGESAGPLRLDLDGDGAVDAEPVAVALEGVAAEDFTPPSLAMRFGGAAFAPPYTEPVEVSVEAADEHGGSGLDRIEWSLEGTDAPPRRWSGPVLVDPATDPVIWVAAVDRAGNYAGPEGFDLRTAGEGGRPPATGEPPGEPSAAESSPGPQPTDAEIQRRLELLLPPAVVQALRDEDAIEAARRGELDRLVELLAAGVGEEAERGALGAAVWAGQPEVVALLLERRPPPAEELEELLRAAFRGDEPAVAEILLARGAAPRSDLLAAAVRAGRAGWVELLERAGAAFGAEELRAQSLAALGSPPTRGRRARGDPEGGRRLLRYLLAHGADPNARDDRGAPLLHRALHDPESVSLLLAGGADPGGRDGAGSRPIHLSYRDAETTALLLAAGADLEGRDAGGRTALQLAAGADPAAAARLLDLGASAGAAAADGRTALHSAILRQHLGLAGLLLDRGAPPDPTAAGDVTPLLELAGGEGPVRGDRNDHARAQMALAVRLVGMGADPRARDGAGRGVLERAAAACNLPLFEALVELGAPVSEEVWNELSAAPCFPEWRSELERLRADLGLTVPPSVPPPDETWRVPSRMSPVRSREQRDTLSAIHQLGRALLVWRLDRVDGSGRAELLDPASPEELEALLVPGYLARPPRTDGWGRPLEVRIRIDPRMGIELIEIRSAGADGGFEAAGAPDGRFDARLDHLDIVWRNGSFVRWPEENE